MTIENKDFRKSTKQSRDAEPSCDKAWQEFFENHNSDIILSYKRTLKGGYRDIHEHVDTDFELLFEGKVATQEKVLSFEEAWRDTATVEYHQNRFTKEEVGEYFDIKAKYYLSGYLNEDKTAFIKYVIFDVKKFLEWQKDKYKHLIPSTSQADFIAILYNDLPDNVVLRMWREEDGFIK